MWMDTSNPPEQEWACSTAPKSSPNLPRKIPWSQSRKEQAPSSLYSNINRRQASKFQTSYSKSLDFLMTLHLHISYLPRQIDRCQIWVTLTSTWIKVQSLIGSIQAANIHSTWITKQPCLTCLKHTTQETILIWVWARNQVTTTSLKPWQSILQHQFSIFRKYLQQIALQIMDPTCVIITQCQVRETSR